MGWFRRDEPGDGLYRGDAPVSVPGVGDQAPSPYRTPSESDPPRPVESPAHRWDPPGGAPPGSAAGPLPVMPGPPAGVVMVDARRAGARRRPAAGCGLIVVLVVAVVTGLVVFAAVRSGPSTIADPQVPATEVGAVDVPVTVTYDGASLRMTVTGVQAQPGSGWDQPTGEPTLLVSMAIERVDDGSAAVFLPFVDWTFLPTGGGAPADVDIVSGFEPDLTSVSLDAGGSTAGYLAFTTGAGAGRLQLAGRWSDDPPLAAWDLTAGPAVAAAGSVGVPVRPQIGLPPFTVTLDSTAWADRTLADAWQPPASGSFLVADLTVASTGGEFSEWVEDESFVFVPAGGQPVAVAAPDVVSSARSFASVAAGGTAPLRAVFDTAVAAGTLEMHDAAGRTMVSWPVA